MKLEGVEATQHFQLKWDLKQPKRWISMEYAISREGLEGFSMMRILYSCGCNMSRRYGRMFNGLVSSQ